MNLFTKPMSLLTAVILEAASQPVVNKLLSLGVMDFVRIEKISPAAAEKLSAHAPSRNREELEDLRQKIEALLASGGDVDYSSISLEPQTMTPVDVSESRRFLSGLASSVQKIKDSQKTNNQKFLSCQELVRYIREGRRQYYDLHVGTFPGVSDESVISRFQPLGAIVLPLNDSVSILLYLRRDGSRVNPLLDKLGWIESDDASLQRDAEKKILEKLDDEVRTLQDAVADLNRQAKDMIARKRGDLEVLWANIRLNQLSESMSLYFSHTRNTALFSGWVPVDQMRKVEAAIREASEGQSIIEWTSPAELPRSEIPVAVDAPSVLEPFERIVTNYNTPEYGTINPLLFVTVAYLCMFGLMFADAGQGLVLSIVGIIGSLMYKKNPARKEGMLTRNLCHLLIFLGGASVVAGALFGSYFGFPLFPPIWFNYHGVVNGHVSDGRIRTIYDILGITIKFGICIISLGLVLNWINLIRKKDWFTLILDKNGLVGGWLYGCGIYIGFAFVGSGYKTIPMTPLLTGGIVVPIVLLFLKGFLAYVLEFKAGGHRKKVGTVIIGAFMEWIVDVLEIFSGFLSNTLSFMRVAGLGIAHVSLMVAFADMAALVNGGIAGFLILLVGNVLVIALEGLSAGIQSLRLNYYEFFSRYFTGKGIAYEPIGLRTKK
ncbi:V-type ATP synthase subunit I [Parasphaerochaeta coccoides]|uniref:V-type ATPase 116 kDa subunit n=1 Tax=Parasphaerochaeta coccoides (strain ATCC BAA-1237 / DSM 17374 / SPN1) TaxID=760011 RepID=F4GH87_PARC1|nr:V-type ATPase 116kDa subunit family protein [Parasphaerochaeta coccoides]AEC01986.1 V-type ATPase 116 kDa subunit [Parasphaerochaeta coccoides DSM 17374]